MSKSLNDKVRGALYAFAIGDAMGATTEFMREEEVKARYGEVHDLIGGGWLRLKPGQITDDTQMTQCVMDALIVNKAIRVDGETLWRIADRFVKWRNSNPPDIGGACNARIAQMDSYPKVGGHVSKRTAKLMITMKNEDALGNGSLMRAVPLALLGRHDVNALQGKLTHNNQTCVRALVSYSKALYVAMFTGKLPKRPSALLAPSGHVKSTFNNVCWHAQSGVEAGIVAAVNRGGDADTIAAITGGLAGAAFGLKSVPERWIEQLDDAVCEDIENFSKCACKHLKGVL